MSDVMNEKYLYAIIRKPQEGKTFICLENIKRSPNEIHLIITMNTIKSNLQFFSRAKEQFEDKICVFNSRVKKTQDFRHAKDVLGVKKHLIDGSDVIIMCAHHKRFDESIIDLLDEIHDSISLNKNVTIHIDEAHAYVPPYKARVAQMNFHDVTHRIYMYTATPFNIWAHEESNCRVDSLFKNIFIVDCERDFEIMRSEKYFGVKDCEIITSDTSYQMITNIIPSDFIQRWGNPDQKIGDDIGVIHTWYESEFKFDLGNEFEMLSYTKNVLLDLKGNEIDDNKYSYNFIPGYSRKLTHYMIAELILETYPSAIVIIINGEGTKITKLSSGKIITLYPKINFSEPSEQIDAVKVCFPNCPVFITGFHCVGMSVTLINPALGNFDNVIISHEQYMERPDVQYQLCRFLFNYITWDSCSVDKIKKTKLFVNDYQFIQNCLDYENQIDLIDTTMAGSLRTLKEVVGSVKIKEKKIPKRKQIDSVLPFTTTTMDLLNDIDVPSI